MTLTPDAAPVRGVAGKPAALTPRCYAPGCGEYAHDGHHMYPRSFLAGQPYDWVELPDGSVWSNRVGMCRSHHILLTSEGAPGGGHGARIQYEPEVWFWVDMVTGEIVPLDPQPLRADDDNPPAPEEHDSNDPQHRILTAGETCSSCGYTKPATRKPAAKRQTLTWGVSVPKDSELGAEVLDGWVSDFSALLGFVDMPGTNKGLLRYHVLTVILAWAAQNQSQLIQDLKDASV